MTPENIRVPIKFLVVGAMNTAFGLITIYLCKSLLALDDLYANISGYSFGLILSFLLNRGWTFRHSGDVSAAMLRFLTIFALAYASNLLAVLIALRVFGVNSYLSQAMGIAPYAVIFYLCSRYFVFGPTDRARG